MTHALGVRVRYDDICNVGLYNTNERQCLLATRSDEVEELAIGFFHEAQIVWTGAFRTTFSEALNSMLFIRLTTRPKFIRKKVMEFIVMMLVDRLDRLIPSMDLLLNRLILRLDQQEPK